MPRHTCLGARTAERISAAVASDPASDRLVSPRRQAYREWPALGGKTASLITHRQPKYPARYSVPVDSAKGSGRDSSAAPREVEERADTAYQRPPGLSRVSDESVRGLLDRLASANAGAAWSGFLERYSPVIMQVIRRYETDH